MLITLVATCDFKDPVYAFILSRYVYEEENVQEFNGDTMIKGSKDSKSLRHIVRAKLCVLKLVKEIRKKNPKILKYSYEDEKDKIVLGHVIVFRGTVKTNLTDLFNDYNILINKIPRYVLRAYEAVTNELNFEKTMKKANNCKSTSSLKQSTCTSNCCFGSKMKRTDSCNSNSNQKQKSCSSNCSSPYSKKTKERGLVLVGHSLGGFLAHSLGFLFNVPSIGIDAPGSADFKEIFNELKKLKLSKEMIESDYDSYMKGLGSTYVSIPNFVNMPLSHNTSVSVLFVDPPTDCSYYKNGDKLKAIQEVVSSIDWTRWFHDKERILDLVVNNKLVRKTNFNMEFSLLNVLEEERSKIIENMFLCSLPSKKIIENMFLCSLPSKKIDESSYLTRKAGTV